MTRSDFLTKWALYALALLPVWLLEAMFLNRVPILGVFPMLLPVAAVTVAVLEGPAGGAGFGLFVGILCDTLYYGASGSMTLALTLIGWSSGAAAQYVLNQSFPGCLLCAAAALTTIDSGRIFLRMFTGVSPLPPLLRVAVPEILYSLCFVPLLYPWFSFVRARTKKLLRL